MHKYSDFVGQIMYHRSHSLIYIPIFLSWLVKGMSKSEQFLEGIVMQENSSGIVFPV